MKILVPALLGLAVPFSVHAVPIKDPVAMYSGYFQSDGTGFNMAALEFDAEIPPSKQAKVLSDILDRALAAKPRNYVLISRTLIILGSLKREIAWDSHLKQTIYDQIRNPDGDVRVSAADLLAKRQTKRGTLCFRCKMTLTIM